MKINGDYKKTIWPDASGSFAAIIDQTVLPHELKIQKLNNLQDAATAIKTMQVRGAPLIGATAAFGIWLALLNKEAELEEACEVLIETRPTAINLKWAIDRMRRRLAQLAPQDRAAAALLEAQNIVEEDIEICRMIGLNGLEIIKKIAAEKNSGEPVQVLTHCNAGWLATLDWGTATAPIYMAQKEGIPVHVWVDETRPRNQGAAITAFELQHQGIPHTVIVDNAGGHLMQHGMVDLCIVGTDRTTANGDVCNKIGTYLKALAAHDNGVPFYVALPSTTIDWDLKTGRDIPIEERGGDEVSSIRGRMADGKVAEVSIVPPGSNCANYAFDVTPARYVTGLITERGCCEASEQGLKSLFSEQKSNFEASVKTP